MFGISKSMLMTVALAIVVIAIMNRVDATRTILNG